MDARQTKRRLSISYRSVPGEAAASAPGAKEEEDDHEIEKDLQQEATNKRMTQHEQRLEELERKVNSGRIVIRPWDAQTPPSRFWQDWNSLMASDRGKDILADSDGVDDNYYSKVELCCFQTSRVGELIGRLRAVVQHEDYCLSITASQAMGYRAAKSLPQALYHKHLEPMLTAIGLNSQWLRYNKPKSGSQPNFEHLLLTGADADKEIVIVQGKLTEAGGVKHMRLLIRVAFNWDEQKVQVAEHFAQVADTVKELHQYGWMVDAVTTEEEIKGLPDFDLQMAAPEDVKADASMEDTKTPEGHVKVNTWSKMGEWPKKGKGKNNGKGKGKEKGKGKSRGKDKGFDKGKSKSKGKGSKGKHKGEKLMGLGGEFRARWAEGGEDEAQRHVDDWRW